MNKITPGPWEWVDNELIGNDGEDVVLYAEEPDIVICSPQDATLIAAAPELLALLEWFTGIKYLSARAGDQYVTKINEANALLARIVKEIKNNG